MPPPSCGPQPRGSRRRRSIRPPLRWRRSSSPDGRALFEPSTTTVSPGWTAFARNSESRVTVEPSSALTATVLPFGFLDVDRVALDAGDRAGDGVPPRHRERPSAGRRLRHRPFAAFAREEGRQSPAAPGALRQKPPSPLPFSTRTPARKPAAAIRTAIRAIGSGAGSGCAAAVAPRRARSDSDSIHSSSSSS